FELVGVVRHARPGCRRRTGRRNGRQEDRLTGGTPHALPQKFLRHHHLARTGGARDDGAGHGHLSCRLQNRTKLKTPCGPSLSRPFRNPSSTRNPPPATRPPAFSMSRQPACIVPPVASTSSISSTRAPSRMPSLCMCSSALPYSSSYFSE